MARWKTHRVLKPSAKRWAILMQLERKNMRQTDLAARVFVSDGFLSGIVNGKIEPSIFHKVRIARVLGVSVKKLFTENLREVKTNER